MTLFWIIAAAMMLVALALLAPTLIRRQRSHADGTQSLNVEIAREHLAELVKQRDAGELSDEEFEQARKDLEFALAQDLEGTRDAPAARGGDGGRWVLPVTVLLIPLITVPLYLRIGSPGLIEPQTATSAVTHGAEGQLPPIEELVKQLRERMEANPDNAEGWFLLGRTYMRLEDYPQAVYAFEKVVALLPEETAGLLSLADALTMRDGRQVGPRAIELLEKALSLEPDSVTALWLLGSAAADRGDTAAALRYWQRAYPLLADEPAMQRELGQMITRAGGEPPATAATLPSIMPAAPTSAPTSAEAGEAPPAAGPGAAIVVEVAVTPALVEKLDPQDTIFVLARAESGPPMPLAVSRHHADELPLRVTLTDEMAMMPSMTLSTFPRVKVTARVSKSGQAGVQPGDMTAGDVVVDSAAPPESVQLLIDQVAQ